MAPRQARPSTTSVCRSHRHRSDNRCSATSAGVWQQPATSSFGACNGSGGGRTPAATRSASPAVRPVTRRFPSASRISSSRPCATPNNVDRHHDHHVDDSETPAIARIDQNGVITALAAGSATFRATAADGLTTATFALPVARRGRQHHGAIRWQRGVRRAGRQPTRATTSSSATRSTRRRSTRTAARRTGSATISRPRTSAPRTAATASRSTRRCRLRSRATPPPTTPAPALPPVSVSTAAISPARSTARRRVSTTRSRSCSRTSCRRPPT